MPRKPALEIPPPTDEQLLRFASRFQVLDNGCWQWAGPLKPYGYGRFRGGATPQFYAHRYSYTVAVGTVASDLVIDHLCRNRGCVNPDHMEPVTAGENVLRGTGAPAVNSRRIVCINGHPLVGDNVRRIRNGKHRYCRDCMNDNNRRQRGNSLAASA